MRDMLRTLLYVLIFCVISAAVIGIAVRMLARSGGNPPATTAPSATMPHTQPEPRGP